MVTELLQTVGRWLAAIPPFVVIPPDERGVMVRLGAYRSTFGPGFHWRIPLFDVVRTVNAAVCTLDLPNQTITGNDKQTRTASGYMRYQVKDPQVACLQEDDHEMSLARQAMKEIAAALAVSGTMATAEGAVLDTLDEFAEAIGIEILEFGLTDYVVAKTIRLIQN